MSDISYEDAAIARAATDAAQVVARFSRMTEAEAYPRIVEFLHGLSNGTFEGNLAEAMKAAGMNQRELAEAAGITGSAVSLFLSGKRNPTMRTVEKLARALDVEPADLIGGV